MAERPTKDASRADWDEYAKSLDLNPDEYANKEALIEAAEAEEITRDLDEPDADADADDEAPGPVDEAPEPTPPGDEVEVGKAGKYPKGYEDATDAWKKAFDHAVKAGNPDKTAIVWADIHHDNEEFSG